jgi:putative NIF3 family GTP cyclohydrolase 1 type 2
MKLEDIYELAVNMGKACDVRGDSLELYLQEQRKRYDDLSQKQRELFDMERLTNPYADTRILAGNREADIKGAFCGIDVETPEIVLADRIKERGAEVDLIIAHHPEGAAQAGLHEVMGVQEDLMVHAGVPVNVAEGIMSSRISEVQRGFMPLNHQRAVDAARILEIPFMCVHSPADNLVHKFLQDLLRDNEYSTLENIMDILLEVPEYITAARQKAGPVILNGKPKNKAGKVFIKVTGGTGGPDSSIEKLADAGVGTFICMHMQNKLLELAKKFHVNVIVAGHMASDSIGMNLFLDCLEQKGVDIIPAAGLIRVSRNS